MCMWKLFKIGIKRLGWAYSWSRSLFHIVHKTPKSRLKERNYVTNAKEARRIKQHKIRKQFVVLAATWDRFSPRLPGCHQMSFLFVLSGTPPRECFTLSISERNFLILSSHLKCCPQGKCAALKGVSSTLMRKLN